MAPPPPIRPLELRTGMTHPDSWGEWDEEEPGLDGEFQVETFSDLEDFRVRLNELFDTENTMVTDKFVGSDGRAYWAVIIYLQWED